MANNRMYLVNKTTGQRLCLGKRMAGQYYAAASAGDIEQFFSVCARDAYQSLETGKINAISLDAYAVEYEHEPDWELI
jgi:ABC-type amino acid transport substrate-binding protein